MRARRVSGAWGAAHGLAAAALVLGFAGAQAAVSVERGRDLYEGRLPMQLAAISTAAGQPPAAPPCMACHRRSGMGNFEGGLAVPPIAGPLLFKPLDRDTSHFFAASSRWRVRPAYDTASLGRLLRTGTTPDGVTLRPEMPRYALTTSDVADLSAYLHTLSSDRPVGLDEHTVRLATVSTPDADPTRLDAMLTVLRHFVAQKNGQSRQEARRSQQSFRTREMVMYRKFRVWELAHWALVGEPETWAAQLAERQAREPVYALVSGMGRADWGPVDQFCERARLLCLLPLVEAGGGASGLYSLHFHAGIESDARLAAQALQARGIRATELWFEPAAQRLANRVRGVLEAQGLQVLAEGAPSVVSLLPPPLQTQRLQDGQAARRPVAWLAGTHALGSEALAATAPWMEGGWIVTPMRTGAAVDAQLQRARLWMKSQRLQQLPVDVGASALMATTVLGEALMHSDFNFTPEYLLELTEHGLESMVPWSPYPRLGLGPDQRIASKGSWLGSVNAGGDIRWEWQRQR